VELLALLDSKFPTHHGAPNCMRNSSSSIPTPASDAVINGRNFYRTF
jgi:hypothetical protein